MSKKEVAVIFEKTVYFYLHDSCYVNIISVLLLFDAQVKMTSLRSVIHVTNKKKCMDSQSKQCIKASIETFVAFDYSISICSD